jgi:hypothetical protein
MGDSAEHWRAFKAVHEASRKRRSRRNRSDAREGWREAARIAEQHGLKLIRHSDVHYKLRGDGWEVELYPGNQRIWSNPQKRGPYLAVRRPWTLMDAVRAAVIATGGLLNEQP